MMSNHSSCGENQRNCRAGNVKPSICLCLVTQSYVSCVSDTQVCQSCVSDGCHLLILTSTNSLMPQLATLFCWPELFPVYICLGQLAPHSELYPVSGLCTPPHWIKINGPLNIWSLEKKGLLDCDFLRCRLWGTWPVSVKNGYSWVLSEL